MKLILYTLLAASLLAATKKENRRGQPELPSTQNCASYYDSTLRQKIYTTATTEPKFGNGLQDLSRYLLKELKLSGGTLNEGDGKMIAEFVVDSNGKVSMVRVVNKEVGAYSALDRGVVTRLKEMPAWNAAKCDGVSVAFLYRLPMAICFKM
jgi:hypothetical protein